MGNPVLNKGSSHPSRLETVIPVSSPGGGGAVPQVDRAVELAQVQNRARALRAMAAGHSSSVDQFNTLNSPWIASTNVPVDVLAFEVPPLAVLMVTRIAVDFYDPIINSGSWLGWRAAVNGGRIQNVGEQGADWSSGGFGGLWEPLEIPPIYVASGDTFRVQAATLTALFAEFVIVSARFTGELISTGKH